MKEKKEKKNISGSRNLPVFLCGVQWIFDSIGKLEVCSPDHLYSGYVGDLL